MADTPVSIAKNVLGYPFVRPDGKLTPEAICFLQSLHTPINGYTKTLPEAGEGLDEAALAAYLTANGYKDHSQLSHLSADDHPQYLNTERGQDMVADLIDDSPTINFTYNDAGDSLKADIDFTGFDTDDITEGTNNLYWTQARFDAATAKNVRFFPHITTPFNTTDNVSSSGLTVTIAPFSIYLRTGKVVDVPQTVVTLTALRNVYFYINDNGTVFYEQVAYTSFPTDYGGSKTYFLYMQTQASTIAGIGMRIADKPVPIQGMALSRRDYDNQSDYYSITGTYSGLARYSLNNGINVYFLETSLVFDAFYEITRTKTVVENLLNFLLICEFVGNSAYQVGQHVRGDRYMYRVTTAGTTSAITVPTWGGTTVSNGTVTFTRMFTLAASPNTPQWFFTDIDTDVDTTATIRPWDSNDSYASVLLQVLESILSVLGAAAFEIWWQQASIIPNPFAPGFLTYEAAIYQLFNANINTSIANGLTYTFQNQRTPFDVANNSQYTYDNYESYAGIRGYGNVYARMTTTTVPGQTLSGIRTLLYDPTSGLKTALNAGIGALYSVADGCMKWEYNTPVRADADWVFYPDVNVQYPGMFNIPLDPIYTRNCWKKVERFTRLDANGVSYEPFRGWPFRPNIDFPPFLPVAQMVKNSRMRELASPCMMAFKAQSSDPRNGVFLIQDDSALRYLSNSTIIGA